MKSRNLEKVADRELSANSFTGSVTTHISHPFNTFRRELPLNQGTVKMRRDSARSTKQTRWSERVQNQGIEKLKRC